MRISAESTLTQATYPIYFEIALQHFQNIRQYTQREPSAQAQHHIPGAREIRDIQKTSMITIVFSAFALEALINSYVLASALETNLKVHLNRLSIASKWVIIPRLTTQKEVDTQGQAYKDFEWLLSRRNQLAHSKGDKKTLRRLLKEDPQLLTLQAAQDAQKAIETVKEMAAELARLDPQADLAWLTDVQRRTHVST